MITKGIINNAFDERNIYNAKNSLLLMSTFIFYSKWKYEFPKKHTRVENFYGSTKEVQMMCITNIESSYYEDEQNQILEMEFVDDSLVITFILPKNREEYLNISYEQLMYYISQLKTTYFNIIKIPKINQQKKIKLDNVLKNIGLEDLFKNISTLNISGSVYISQILQQNCLLINEDGINNLPAYTSTYQTYDKGVKSNRQSNQFIANQPFNYYIRYKPMNILLCTGNFY